MLGFLTRWSSKRNPVPERTRPWRTRPWLEELERRDCPAVPQITAFSAVVQSGNAVQLSGSVTADQLQGVSITFSGAASGSATTDATGNFSLSTSTSTLGTVYAVGVDQQQRSTNQAQSALASNAPAIYDFAATCTSGNWWTFRGRVVDESAPGLTVRLGGLTSLANVTTTVQSDGWFEIAVLLAEGEHGTATAQTTDWWGLDSNTALATVNP